MPRERFEGAITRPDEPSAEVDAAVVAREAARRPPRPALVELAAAILIVSGLAGVATAPSPLVPASGLVPWLFIGLAGLTVVVGFLVRAGRAWGLALNVTAIAMFLEVLALPSPIAVLFLTGDAIVFVALLRHRPWFAWSPQPVTPERAGDPRAR